MAYTEGDRARVGVTFYNALSVVADPTVVRLRVRRPDNTFLEYDYTIDPEIVWESVGNYYADLDLDQGGFWYFRWEGTGVVTAAVQMKFCVEAEFG